MASADWQGHTVPASVASRRGDEDGAAGAVAEGASLPLMGSGRSDVRSPADDDDGVVASRRPTCSAAGCGVYSRGGADPAWLYRGMCLAHFAEANPVTPVTYATKLCSAAGCQKYYQRRGMCESHFIEANPDARDELYQRKVKLCSVPWCEKQARSSRRYEGKCGAHFRESNPGAPSAPPHTTSAPPHMSRICSAAGCTKYAQGGHQKMCKSHFREANPDAPFHLYPPKLCSVPWCEKQANDVSRYKGKCRAHFKASNPGAKTCKVAGCAEKSQGNRCRSMCRAHFKLASPGSAAPRKTTCTVAGCAKQSQGSRCRFMCVAHFREQESQSGATSPQRRREGDDSAESATPAARKRKAPAAP